MMTAHTKEELAAQDRRHKAPLHQWAGVPTALRRKLLGQFLLLVLVIGSLTGCGGTGEDPIQSAGAGGDPGQSAGSGGDPGGSTEAVAVLSWDPPTTNADGTPLSNDLAGYRVYYGTRSPVDTSNGQSIDVGNVVTYTVEGLSPGTYYFKVSAYDLSANESALSPEEASKVITGA
jgi:hypothetical protein